MLCKWFSFPRSLVFGRWRLANPQRLAQDCADRFISGPGSSWLSSALFRRGLPPYRNDPLLPHRRQPRLRLCVARTICDRLWQVTDRRGSSPNRLIRRDLQKILEFIAHPASRLVPPFEEARLPPPATRAWIGFLRAFGWLVNLPRRSDSFWSSSASRPSPCRRRLCFHPTVQTPKHLHLFDICSVSRSRLT